MRRFILFSLCLCLTTPLVAQPTPQGAEFQVNTGGEYVYDPSVAFGSDGRFVVTWTTYDAEDYSVRARRYQADGTPIGGQFQVAPISTEYIVESDAAFASDDSFIVVWDEEGSADFDVLGRTYSSSGISLGGEFVLNSWTTDQQVNPAVARAGDRYVVTWQSQNQDGSGEGIFGRLFTSSGVAVGADFQVNTYTTESQVYPDVAAAPDGRFVVVWTRLSTEAGVAVSARRYASDGSPVGAQFDVGATGEPFEPSIAVGSDGRFVVAFAMDPPTESSLDAPDQVLPISEGVYARRFHSDGSPNGALFPVQTTNTSPFADAEVSMDPSDRFLITWGSGESVRGQRYSSSGIPVDGEFQIASSGGYSASAVDPTADGFVVIWTNTGVTEVRGRLYSGLLPVELIDFSID